MPPEFSSKLKICFVRECVSRVSKIGCFTWDRQSNKGKARKGIKLGTKCACQFTKTYSRGNIVKSTVGPVGCFMFKPPTRAYNIQRAIASVSLNTVLGHHHWVELRATCNSLIQRFNRIFLPAVLLQTPYRSFRVVPSTLRRKNEPSTLETFSNSSDPAV